VKRHGDAVVIKRRGERIIPSLLASFPRVVGRKI